MIAPAKISSRATRAIAVAVTALAALTMLLIPSATAQAATDDVSWTVRTAANDFGDDRTSFRYTVDPGSKVEDALVVVNHGDEALDLGVYAADGYTTESGQFDILAGGKKSTKVGTWVHTDGDRITVQPGETAQVPFTLTVPKNATPGDYAGGLVTSLEQPDSTQQINVDRRLGVRIAVRVGGDLKPGLAVEGLHVDWSGGLNPFAGGDATMTYTLHNTGNAVVSARQTAAVTGPFGWLPAAASKFSPPPQLLPGETWKVSIPFRGVAATIVMVATAKVTPIVTDASGTTTPLDPISVSANGWAVPWMLLLLLLVAAALVFAGIRLWKYRTAQQREREDARVKEAVDLALGIPSSAAPSEG